MKGDFTRLTFDRKKHYRGVLMQQGRVQLDSDWNEQVQIAEHRFTTFFSDFVGQSGTRGDDMRLQPVSDSGGQDAVVVRSGHYYVDGLLVENDADLVLSAPGLEGDGQYLYYLDVWTREVTAAEDEDLRETALGGPDTTARIKTEWQVLCRKIEEPAAKEGWEFPQSTGKIEVNAANLPSADNRLYRVEIHDSQSGKVSFKWSSDNGSVVAPARAVDKQTITLAHAGLNIQNAFSGAAFVEVYDLSAAGSCTPGYLGRVDSAGSDLKNGRIAIQDWVGREFPGTALSSSKENPLIVRRWDGFYSRAVPSGSGRGSFDLEDALNVSFYPGVYRCGDYWLILLRSGIVQNWKTGETRLPDGIEHHYAALALIGVKDGRIAAEDGIRQVTDLRVLFEPLTSHDVSTSGDACIGGKLGVGFQDLDLLRSSKSRVCLRAGAESTVELQDGTGKLCWRVSNNDPNRLDITDEDGNGVSIQKGGRVGIGTRQAKSALQVGSATSISQGSSGQDWSSFGCNLFYDGQWKNTTDGRPGAAVLVGGDAFEGQEFRVYRKVNDTVENLASIGTTKSFIRKGNLGVGTDDPRANLVVGDKRGAVISGGPNSGAVFGNNLATKDGEDLYVPYPEMAQNSGIHAHLGTLAFYTAGSGRGDLTGSGPGMYIDENGNVGIGTTQTDRARLVVDGDVYVTGRIREAGKVMHFPTAERREVGISNEGNAPDEGNLLSSLFYLAEQREVVFCVSAQGVTRGNGTFAVSLTVRDENGSEVPTGIAPLNFASGNQDEKSGLLRTSLNLKEGVYTARVDYSFEYSSSSASIESISLLIAEKETVPVTERTLPVF